MEAKATSKFILISARKARLVANEVRGYGYQETMDILRFTPKKGAKLIGNVVQSAYSNAVARDENLKEKDLFVKKIYVDEGPTLKRFRPRARGRAMQRLKRTSHITVVLGT